MKARWFKLMMNCYPPFIGAGIKVAKIEDSYRYLRVEMPLRWYNRNYVGTHYGGNLSSMTDPFYMLMLLQNLGKDYIVWDQAGTIEYCLPGRGRVSADFEISDDLLSEIKSATASGEKLLKVLPVNIHNEQGEVVAKVTRTLYIRLRKKKR
ncbi:DUF4442 domain-containing protein [Aliiglaciecola sp. CAU 1673]|uniref:DUF4442 domain-containing protein n=1 Tax=Aliiglaciecola sp. CAU 1673 TaxID=3032595 RepID=UPI0023DA2801|nr:DUF4442 domain-containing protein [Aliiglaciecola sp. CAU 1673]MDF2176948.1 DUF4442 domain-containing protein [Aliiglaciecola sp. CAU 1673]